MKKLLSIIIIICFFIPLSADASFFSRFKKKDEPKKGYKGVLPDIERDFEYLKQKTDSPKPKEDELLLPEDIKEETDLKPAPFDDALFLDVIIKKDKTSNWVNDIQKTKFALKQLKTCIENNDDIQHYNAVVNLLDLYSKNLKTKYENKSESLLESYIEILNTTYYAKVLGNLMYDSNYYARYIPLREGQYSKYNIDLKKQDLLNRINKTLFIISNDS